VHPAPYPYGDDEIALYSRLPNALILRLGGKVLASNGKFLILVPLQRRSNFQFPISLFFLFRKDNKINKKDRHTREENDNSVLRKQSAVAEKYKPAYPGGKSRGINQKNYKFYFIKFSHLNS